MEASKWVPYEDVKQLYKDLQEKGGYSAEQAANIAITVEEEARKKWPRS